MSWGGLLAEGADILRAVETYVVHGLALEALYNSGVGRFRSVGDDDGIVAGSGLHSHLQSSGECNMSSAHSRSTSSANPSPTLLSWCSVVTISFPWGKGGGGPRVVREGVGSSSQLGKGINSSVH